MSAQIYLIHEGVLLDCVPLKLFEFLSDHAWDTLGKAYDVADANDIEFVCTDWEGWKDTLKGALM